MNFYDDDDLDCELEECNSGDELEMEEIQIWMAGEEEYRYEVLGPEEIVADMLKKINSINSILQISNTTTRILLHHFKWDEEKLLEKFYAGNRAVLFKEAHVVDPELVGKKVRKLPAGSKEDCDICLSPLPRNLMSGLECGHRYCGDCWDGYLSVKVMEEGECLTISCPAHKCDILVDDATAMALIKNSKVRSKYQYLITQSFVECNRLLKWCPTPDCGRAIKVQYVDFKPVTCLCGQTFCFKCSEKWHAPILCEYLKKWLKKTAKDLATSTWIIMNTKDCPKCAASIEKNGGCNHMTCRKCKFEFCWVCSGNWTTHNLNYQCNRYQETEDAAQVMELTKSELKRYLFYYDRYMSHMKSSELENNLYLIVGSKMLELQQLDMSWIEVQFLNKAVNVLSQCRQTLMYSYAFAYYLEKCNQSAIFEDNQQDLEKATEALSHYLEQDLEDEKVEVIKQRVQDKARYCENRIKVLLDHVNEGYDKNCWKHLGVV